MGVTSRRAVGVAAVAAGWFMVRVAVNGQRSARAIESTAAKVAGEIHDAVTFAREMDELGVKRAQRQQVMNAYLRGRREGSARG